MDDALKVKGEHSIKDEIERKIKKTSWYPYYPYYNMYKIKF